MRIYVDFDDVLCETARALSAVARQVFERDVPYEEISVFDLKHAFSLSGDEIDKLMDIAHEIPFLEGLDPAPGAVEAIKRLHSQGHEVIIVTGRPSYCHEGSIKWMKRFGLEFIEILYVDKYGRAPAVVSVDFPLVMGLEDFYQQTFDVAIDDSPTALELLAKMENCNVIIFNRPWNRHYRPARKMTQCSSWDEIMTLF